MTDIQIAAGEAAQLLAPSSDDPVLHRISHRVFRCTAADRSIVVKLFEPDSIGAFGRELAGADIAGKAIGSWVPPMVGSGTLMTGHVYVARDEVNGIDLLTAVETTELSRTGALRLIGAVLARFHRLTRTGFGPVAAPSAASAHEQMVTLVDERAPMLAAYGEPGLATVLADLAAKLAAPLGDLNDAVLCHGDLHLRNVIVTAAGAHPEVRGVVDYESATFAVPEYDLAKTIVVSNAFTAPDRQVLLAGYGRCDVVDDIVLADFVTYHTIDGWLWAGLVENRDRNLWRTRLQTVLS